MQLFRQQALDHQNRFHGEVFLVPPLRWQAIGWLLFLAVAAGILTLALGTHSETIDVQGVLQPRIVGQDDEPAFASQWTAQLAVPASQIARVKVGQAVRISLAGYPTQDFGALEAKVIAIGADPVDGAAPHFKVIASLAPLTPQQQKSGLMLRSNWQLKALIVVNQQSILRWLGAPKTT